MMSRFKQLFSTLRLPISFESRCTVLKEYCTTAPDSELELFVALSLAKRVFPFTKNTLLEVAESVVSAYIPAWLIQECITNSASKSLALSRLLPAGSGLHLSSLSELLTHFPVKNAVSESVLLNMDSVEQELFFLLVSTPRIFGITPFLLSFVLEAHNKEYLAPYSKPLIFPEPVKWEGAWAELGDIGSWQLQQYVPGTRVQVCVLNNTTCIWDSGYSLQTQRYPQLTITSSLTQKIHVFGVLNEISSVEELHSVRSTTTNNNTGVIVDSIWISQSDEYRFATTEEQNLFFSENSHYTRNPALVFNNWNSLQDSIAAFPSGFVAMQRTSTYKMLQQYRILPNSYSMLAVILYVQTGAEYTLAVRDRTTFVPILKGYIGLDHNEHAYIDSFVKSNTIEKFGPVRSVPARIVVYVEFNSVQTSKRRKSGVAVSGVRLIRIEPEIPPEAVTTLEEVQKLCCSVCNVTFYQLNTWLWL